MSDTIMQKRLSRGPIVFRVYVLRVGIPCEVSNEVGETEVKFNLGRNQDSDKTGIERRGGLLRTCRLS